MSGMDKTGLWSHPCHSKILQTFQVFSLNRSRKNEHKKAIAGLMDGTGIKAESASPNLPDTMMKQLKPTY
eukprot:3417889-Ditylum_brightwellii.AAC.1